MKQWLKYFLVGVAETAEESARTLSSILFLKEKHEKKINAELGRKGPSGLNLLNRLFVNPIITVNQAKKATGLSYNSANSLISDFINLQLLREVTGYNRNRVFVYNEYLRLFEK